MNKNYDLLRNKDIIAILDGDSQIEEIDGIRIAMPYLSGPMLCELSQKFGCYQEYYWGNSSKPNLSRWQYMDNILNLHDDSDIVKNEIEKTYHTENRNKLPVSYDLWEMNEGVHIYSLASIYAAFSSIMEMYKVVKPEYEEKSRLILESMNKIEKKKSR